MEYDEKVELEFLDGQIKKLQLGLLQAENEDIPAAELIVKQIKEAVDRDKKKLDEYRVKRIRLAAEMEEAKRV